MILRRQMMLKKLLIGSIVLSIVSLSIIIIGMFTIYNRGIKVFEEEQYTSKNGVFNLFVEDVYSELNILTKAHAYWTLANEAIQANDIEWIQINLTEYLYEGDFGIDVLLIAKEDGTIVDSFGFDTIDITETNIYNKVLDSNSEENAILWIGENVYFISAMPIADDNENAKSGVFILGRVLSGDLREYLESIVEPVHSEDFTIYPDISTVPPSDDHVVFSRSSIDDDLVVYAHLEYTFTTYIRENIIGHTIVIVSAMFIINVTSLAVAIVIAAKHHSSLINSVDSIQLDSQTFTRIPNNKILELDMIAKKINEMLLRMEQDYRELSNKNIEIVQLLSKVNEINDLYTKEHSDNVSIISEEIGRRLRLDNLDSLVLSAQLHDVGKVFIPLEVLNKKGPLTKDEYAIIKSHPQYGYNILHDIKSFKEINEGILSHHERFDGKGYPNGLSGKNIPLFARIIAVADVYDALTSERPYRDAMNEEQAQKIIAEQSGKHFDPDLVEIFFQYIHEKSRK